ncbi:MAG: sigma-54-dependent Fis family transcriptional regulator [Rhodobacteraceae bacterium]|nr:sigma-54-dependent Fis family transcriptional regulator [Paracoccaceae bacterium]
MKRQVLLIEDDDALRASLAQTLDLEGIDVISTAHFVQARRTLRANFAGVVLTDIRMPDKDGFEILALAQSIDADLPVVMLTGEGDVPMAIRAMKEGAYDFLEKPCETSHLVGVLNRALAHRELVLHTRRMEQKMRRSDPASVHFPGDSPASRDFREALRRAADSGRHILLVGPEGAGKKLAAHTIFAMSEGRDTFVLVRTPEIDPAGFKVEDGAVDLSVKRVHLASYSQLDCVISQVEQRPELRFIGSAEHSVPEVADRLNCITVAVPDLAARRSDLGVIFEVLLRHAVRYANAEMPDIPAATLAEIEARDWPGNLAELRDYANRFLSDPQGGTAENPTLAEQMEAHERLVLENTLRSVHGKAAEAAKKLGLPRKTLYDRLARYGLRPRDYQG